MFKAVKREANRWINSNDKDGPRKWATLNDATDEVEECNWAPRADAETKAEEVEGRTDSELIMRAAHGRKYRHDPAVEDAGERARETERGHHRYKVLDVRVAAGTAVGIEGDRVADEVATSAEALLSGVNMACNNRGNKTISVFGADFIIRVFGSKRASGTRLAGAKEE